MKKWLPNWNNPDEYPDPLTATPAEWAWEFLRRNHKYQNMYVELKIFEEESSYDAQIKRCESFETNSTINIGKALNLIDQRNDLFRQIVKKFGVETDSNRDIPNPTLPYKEAQPNFPVKGAAIYDTYTERFLRLQEGAFTDKNHYLFPGIPQLQSININNREAECHTFTHTPNMLIFGLDIEQSIPKQIDKIKRFAKREQNKLLKKSLISKPRDQTDNYLDYLRALDADSQGVDKNTIASSLLPQVKYVHEGRSRYHKIKNWIARAKEIRDHDFLLISSLDPY